MIKIKTTKLQQMLSKVTKCSSNNKLFPITTLIGLSTENDKLMLTTTDGSNYMRMFTSDVEITPKDDEVNSAVVSVDVFNKLITKTTNDYTKLSLYSNEVIVNANGKYSIPVQTEDDEVIHYPFPELTDDPTTTYEVELSTVKKVIANVKASLATTLEIPALTGYYSTENSVIGSDTFTVANYDIGLSDTATLYTPKFLELTASLPGDKITIEKFTPNYLQIKSDSITIIGTYMNEIEDYPIDAINQFISLSFTNKVELDKTALIDVLDRLSIFVSDYDNRAIYMEFNSNGCTIYNKRDSAKENLTYASADISDVFKCLIDVEILKAQINEFPTGNVCIEYDVGSPAIKISSEHITKVIALIDDIDNEE